MRQSQLRRITGTIAYRMAEIFGFQKQHATPEGLVLSGDHVRKNRGLGEIVDLLVDAGPFHTLPGFVQVAGHRLSQVFEVMPPKLLVELRRGGQSRARTQADGAFCYVLLFRERRIQLDEAGMRSRSNF